MYEDRHLEADFDDFEIDTDEPIESDNRQIHRAANGHTMSYRVKPNGDLSQWDATCVYDCGACRAGDQRPDW